MTSFTDSHHSEYGAEPICRELPIVPSTYYLCLSDESSLQKR